jgi:hypothetical protein|tara:strand:+ start:443 stop:952 length:510 start_codon:yes stop_codon:yes gene_type:complete
MGQEFFINSQELESKIRQLLPSQGGGGAGFDLSASTQIIPIIDLTESAEGSNVRADLQSSLSHDTITTFSVTNATDTVIVSNTGYFRVFGSCWTNGNATSSINLFDGSTSKDVIVFHSASSGVQMRNTFDYMVKLNAGDSLRVTSSGVATIVNGCTRQIADIDGNLTNP